MFIFLCVICNKVHSEEYTKL